MAMSNATLLPASSSPLSSWAAGAAVLHSTVVHATGVHSNGSAVVRVVPVVTELEESLEEEEVVCVMSRDSLVALEDVDEKEEAVVKLETVDKVVGDVAVLVDVTGVCCVASRAAEVVLDAVVYEAAVDLLSAFVTLLSVEEVVVPEVVELDLEVLDEEDDECDEDEVVVDFVVPVVREVLVVLIDVRDDLLVELDKLVLVEVVVVTITPAKA